MDSVCCFVFSFKHLQLSANHSRVSELLCAFQFLLKRLLQKQQTKGVAGVSLQHVVVVFAVLILRSGQNLMACVVKYGGGI